VSAVLEALARRGPDEAALVDDAGVLGAGALIGLAHAEARWLQRWRADRLALLAANGRAWAIIDLALSIARRIGVPLPHHFGETQLAHALQSAGVGAVLTDAPARILELGLGFVPAGTSPQTGLELVVRNATDVPSAVLPAGTARITYTSGSTAEPKGVCLGEAVLGAVARAVAGIARGLGIERHLSLLPLATLLENVAGLHAAWIAGAVCHLPSAVPAAIARGALTPGLLLAEMTRTAPQSSILVPELLRILVEGVESGWTPPAARFLAVGGARVAPALLERAAAAGLPVFEGYGLSECASVVCLNIPGAARPGSVGRPLPHARVCSDERGEIRVAGALMAGYVGAADAPVAELATGDVGEIDADGYVYVRGRLKNLLITAWGRNLSPEWIESELAQEPAIGQAIVFGEARTRLVALIARAGPGVSDAAIAAGVARANARLPEYARIACYSILEEPMSAANGLLTGNGRPRRVRIRERFAGRIESLYQETSDVVC
jgi:long-subunit acyl-CoA synthetase (AMP-forming)